MRGIDTYKAEQNAKRYVEQSTTIWKESEETLAELGEKYDLTKQRVWQIITRCKLGDGDYYRGVQIARNKWTEFVQQHQDMNKLKGLTLSWLKKLILN